MTDVLVLGGTGWLSARIARDWRDAGARVTCVARGDRQAPEGTTLVRADREHPEAYAELAKQDWDEIVDVSSRARHVQQAVAALGECAAHWSYVSSMSVYADSHIIGADESAPRHAPAQQDDDYDYAAQKVAAEQAVSALGERAFIVRPGLIIGDGDPSDRFGYWAAALQRAGAEPVLTPLLAARAVQVIDVDDLSAFVSVQGRTGMVNAIGDVHCFADILSMLTAATGYRGSLREADDAWLESHGVQHWAGERSLPLWLPAEMPGFMRRDNTAYHRDGGTLRPLPHSIERVLADERSRGVDRARSAGLTRAQEIELLRALAG